MKSETRTHEGEQPPPDSLLSRFGLRVFRPGQRDVIAAVLAGRDCLCIMPTGGGKSLCYQLPSLVRQGTTLVVSPLIALMKDQVDSLAARSIRASFVNSSLDLSEQHGRLEALARQEFDLMYVAPERFRSQRFLESVRQANVQLLAIDEAHCISEWGHDFRHDYARLGEFRQKLGDPQTMALTATATEEVRQDIAKQLRLKAPATFVAGFQRPNLHLAVTPCRDRDEKRELLTRFLRRTTGSGIIYAATRRACESIASEISPIAGRSIVVYHGGLEPDQRRRRQEAFMHGDAQIAVATNAFGMGIDKADVRFVIHYHFPGSVEAYYQEAGRAGRDGEPAECLMLFSQADRRIQEFFIESAYPAPEVVRDVYEFLCQQEDDPVEITQQEIKDRLKLSISSEGIGTCERLLERAGALERLEPNRNMAIVRILSSLPTLVDLLPKQATVQRQVLRHAERVVGDHRSEDVFFSPQRWSAELGLAPASLGRTLRELERLEVFQYIPPFRGRAIRISRRQTPFTSWNLDFEGLLKRKMADYRKLNKVLQLASSPRCRQRFILEYFGDPAASDCGNCDACRVETAWSVDGAAPAPATQFVPVRVDEVPAVHQALRITLSGVARTHARVGKQLVSAMLQGSRAAKVLKSRLDQLSTFGLLSYLAQSDVLALLDACLEQHWVESHEVNRFRPVLRVTDPGRAVMRASDPPHILVRLPRLVVSKIVGQVPPPHMAPSATRSPEPASPTDEGEDPANPVSTEDFAWTWRLLQAGFKIRECMAIRRLNRDSIVRHVAEAVDAGCPVEPSHLYSPQEIRDLEKLPSKPEMPGSDSRNRDEVLLFQKMRARSGMYPSRPPHQPGQ